MANGFVTRRIESYCYLSNIQIKKLNYISSEKSCSSNINSNLKAFLETRQNIILFLSWDSTISRKMNIEVWQTIMLITPLYVFLMTIVMTRSYYKKKPQSGKQVGRNPLKLLMQLGLLSGWWPKHSESDISRKLTLYMRKGPRLNC